MIAQAELSKSQVGQDLFVATMHKEKENGYYVEIGACHPVWNSNTYMLETGYNWKGLAIEWNEHQVEVINEVRTNKCIHGNAVTYDYQSELDRLGFPQRIDYLSVDIEPPTATFAALKHIILNTSRRFTVVTFEHDAYGSGAEVKAESREFMQANGYRLLCPSITSHSLDFEDWYVDEQAIGNDLDPAVVNGFDREDFRSTYRIVF